MAYQADLVFKDEKTDKFWSIVTEGSGYRITYGKTGTKGQTTAKELGSPEEAEAAAKKEAQGKLKKGYKAKGA